MAATATSLPGSRTANPLSGRIVPVNSAPADFDAQRDLPKGFLEFLTPLHAALTLRQRSLVMRREVALGQSHAGKLPGFFAAFGGHHAAVARGIAILVRRPAQPNDRTR